jgi:hypothetical protein
VTNTKPTKGNLLAETGGDAGSPPSRPKSVTVLLSEPVEHDGRTYTELTFRRMRAGDALIGEAEKSQTHVGYMVFAAMADVPFEVIAALDVADITEITEKIAPLLATFSFGGQVLH